MLFAKIEQAPGTDFKKVEKSLFSLVLGYWYALGDEGQGKNSYYAVLNGPQLDKTCIQGIANNTGADQPAHPHSLISTFVIRLLESIISKHAIGEISLF